MECLRRKPQQEPCPPSPRLLRVATRPRRCSRRQVLRESRGALHVLRAGERAAKSGVPKVGTRLARTDVMKTTAIRRILVPVDFSSCSRAALELACSLGTALDATLDVLYVADGADRQASFGPKEAEAAKQELHRFIGTVPASASLSIGERVEVGEARERIVAAAEREAFDLVVLGTHGRTGRPRSLAGSVAESVVRTSTRPVLTVREP